MLYKINKAKIKCLCLRQMRLLGYSYLPNTPRSNWGKGAGFAYKGFWIWVTEVVKASVYHKKKLLLRKKYPVCKMGSFTKIIIASICVIFLAVKWTAPRFNEGKTEIQPKYCTDCIQVTQTCTHIKDCT